MNLENESHESRFLPYGLQYVKCLGMQVDSLRLTSLIHNDSNRIRKRLRQFIPLKCRAWNCCHRSPNLPGGNFWLAVDNEPIIRSFEPSLDLSLEEINRACYR